jgi:hypothetical protein
MPGTKRLYLILALTASVCSARESLLKLTCILALFMASTWSRAKWHLNTTLIWHQP